MPTISRITLLFVVFVDLIGQGLVFPIVNTLIMEPSFGFLPSGTSTAVRHFDYGLVIGSFFLAWFLGVVYIARISDAVGRKRALLVCLGGALIGYVITIVALLVNSLWLLIFGRVVTGFTAGNQPVAQAAMIDGSRDEVDRDRNMGYIVTGVSFGLVGGPIIGGILSDKDILGRFASVSMPFYGALALVLIAIVLVIVFFEDLRMERQPFSFHPSQIFETLWRVTKFPIVLTVLPVYVCFMTANVTFYVFVDNYLTSAFGYGVIGSSAVMLVIGIALAYSSTFLVEPAQKRFSKQRIIAVSLGVMAASSIAFVASPVAVLCFIPVFAFYFIFGVSYPTLLGIFSGSVESADQGWVMGITTAVFTLAGGVMSLIGGGLMSVSIRLPFFLVIIAALLGLLAMVIVWRNSPAIRHLTDSPAKPSSTY